LDQSRSGDIEFRGALLPPSSILVRGSRAQAILSDATDHAIVGQCAHALGSMRTMLESTASYLTSRTQFAQTLGSFQALQHRMAEMFSEYDRFRSITYRAAAKLRNPAAERAAAVSAAKFLLGKFAASVGGTMVHLHGAIGMTEALPIGPHFRALLMSAQRYGVGAHHLDRYVRLAGTGMETQPGI
jgi:alkylation response protein AidB-like acyl-CoA dehydrogenase